MDLGRRKSTDRRNQHCRRPLSLLPHLFNARCLLSGITSLRHCRRVERKDLCTHRIHCSTVHAVALLYPFTPTTLSPSPDPGHARFVEDVPSSFLFVVVSLSADWLMRILVVGCIRAARDLLIFLCDTVQCDGFAPGLPGPFLLVGCSQAS